MRIHRPSSGLGANDTCGIGFSHRSDTSISTSDVRAGIFSTYNGEMFLATESGGNLNSNPNDHARLYIDGAGLVGIGDTSPSYPLDVNGIAQMTSLRLANGFQLNQGGSTYAQLGSWIDVLGVGLYSSTVNGAHIYPCLLYTSPSPRDS